MRTLVRLLRSSCAAAALAGAAFLLAPAAGPSLGFTKLGESLDADTQRDFRVFNNFNDSLANANQQSSANYPNWFGAEQALWKSASEWASRPHGTGAGDPTQPNLGDGGANFDFFFAGTATAAGTDNGNIVSTVPLCGGGLLAYVITPIANGWTMKFCEDQRWAGGTGAPPTLYEDIQATGTHEFGHALGLGHSTLPTATMFGTTGSGSISWRTIEADDIAGVQCIYGPSSASKVEVTGALIDVVQGFAVITGSNFATTGNEVWFTRAAASTPGSMPQVRVTGLDSTAGGTQITIDLPAEAGSGDLAVKVPGSGPETLSNAWPADLVNGAAGPLVLSGVSPPTVESLIPGTAQTVTISGQGFTGATTLSLDLVAIDPSQYTLVDAQTITLDMPQTDLGMHTLELQRGTQTASGPISVVAPAGPVLQAGNGDPFNVVANQVEVTIAGPVGELEYVVYSLSNLPSVFLPFAQLEIGNNFSDLNLVQTYVIPAAGWTSETFPLNPGLAIIYMQALTLAQGLPAVDSNVTSFLISF